MCVEDHRLLMTSLDKFEEADKRKMDVSEEKKEQRIVKAVLAEAKITWHAFGMLSFDK